MRRPETSTRRALAAAMLLAVVTGAKHASAQEVARSREGLYLRLGLGASYFSDSVESEPLPLPYGVVRGSIKGTAFAAEGSIGYAVTPGLYLGGGCFFHYIPSASTTNGEINGQSLPDEISYAATTLVLVGPFADYYPSAASGFHVQASAGYGVLSLGAGTGSKPPNRPYVDEQSGAGLAFLVGAGYDFWSVKKWSVGALARLTGGWGSGNDQTDHAWHHSVFAPALLLTATMN